MSMVDYGQLRDMMREFFEKVYDVIDMRTRLQVGRHKRTAQMMTSNALKPPPSLPVGMTELEWMANYKQFPESLREQIREMNDDLVYPLMDMFLADRMREKDLLFGSEEGDAIKVIDADALADKAIRDFMDKMEVEEDGGSE